MSTACVVSQPSLPRGSPRCPRHMSAVVELGTLGAHSAWGAALSACRTSSRSPTAAAAWFSPVTISKPPREVQNSRALEGTTCQLAVTVLALKGRDMSKAPCLVSDPDFPRVPSMQPFARKGPGLQCCLLSVTFVFLFTDGHQTSTNAGSPLTCAAVESA